MTNLSYTVLLTTSLSTTLLKLLKSAGKTFSLFIPTLSASGFKLLKSDFGSKVDASTPFPSFKLVFVA